jgi:hypothetical protein
MAIYKGSRYKGSYIYSDLYDREKIFLDVIQDYKFLPSKEDLIVEFREGDRLDILAKKFYGDETLEWVILQANPQYDSPFDIASGDFLNIPLPEKVRDIVV